MVKAKRKLQKENFSEDAAKCNCKVDVHSACLSRCISTFLKETKHDEVADGRVPRP